MCVVSQHKAPLCFLLMSTLLPQQTGVGGKEVVCVRVHRESYCTRCRALKPGSAFISQGDKNQSGSHPFLLQPLSDYVIFFFHLKTRACKTYSKIMFVFFNRALCVNFSLKQSIVN